MDALQNRTNDNGKDATSPVGRNGITLTTNANIAISGSGTFTQIVNGVDDNPITVADGSTAKIAIGSLTAGTTYAYVYVTTAPSADEKIYNVVSASTASTTPGDYYEVALAGEGSDAVKAAGSKAAAGKVYFVKNVDETGAFVSYTFKQTKVGDDVKDLVKATIDPAVKATSHNVTSAGNYYFYFDVYNQNNGAYAVKVFKVAD
jgi:hypothetical protein